MDLSWMTHYTPWLVLIVFCCIHYTVYHGTKLLLAGWLDNADSIIFLDLPLPWLMHLALAHVSLLITIFVVWLTVLI